MNYLGLRHMNHGLTLIASFFSFVQSSFQGILGGASGHVHLGYIRFFRKTGQGSWLRGDSALGPPV